MPHEPPPEIVGLIAAAGLGTRLAPLPCSKELLPVGFRGEPPDLRPKVVSHYLVESFRTAGVRRVVFVLRRGKWDIPAYYGDGSEFGIDAAYVTMRLPHGPAFTLDSAYAFVRGVRVAVGFPDIIHEPHDAFARIRADLEASSADAVLGLFPAPVPHPCDRVWLQPDGRVREIEPKPPRVDSGLSWAIAVWSPRFTEFLHAHVAAPHEPGMPEVSVGHVLRAALAAGLAIRGVVFDTGWFLDVGTPEGLREATRRFAR